MLDLTVEVSSDNAFPAVPWSRTWFFQGSFKKKTSQTPPLYQPNNLEKVGQSWPVFPVLQVARADLHVGRSHKMYYVPNRAKQGRRDGSTLQEGDRNIPIWTNAAPVCTRVAWMGNWVPGWQSSVGFSNPFWFDSSQQPLYQPGCWSCLVVVHAPSAAVVSYWNMSP